MDVSGVESCRVEERDERCRNNKHERRSVWMTRFKRESCRVLWYVRVEERVRIA